MRHEETLVCLGKKGLACGLARTSGLTILRKAAHHHSIKLLLIPRLSADLSRTLSRRGSLLETLSRRLCPLLLKYYNARKKPQRQTKIQRTSSGCTPSRQSQPPRGRHKFSKIWLGISSQVSGSTSAFAVSGLPGVLQVSAWRVLNRVKGGGVRMAGANVVDRLVTLRIGALSCGFTDIVHR
jgi:hypothetical protein